MDISPGKTLYLSHSSIALYRRNPWAWYQRYVSRLESEVRSANLVYGTAYDEAVTAFVVADTYGQELDPRPIFEEAFLREASKGPVEYSSVWKDGQDAMIAAGLLSLERFVEKWHELGYAVALDRDGKPLAQREVRVRLEPRIIFTAIIDFVVMDSEARLLLLDLKTAAQKSHEGFEVLSDQLAGNQLCVEAHAEQLGIEQLDGIGFIEATKVAVPKGKGKGPQVLDPVIVPPRTQRQQDEFVQMVQWTGDDIRRGRFPKPACDAFDSPWQLCEFRNLALTGSMQGLRKRPPWKSRRAETVNAAVPG